MADNLTVEKDLALKYYNDADKKQKEVLELLFGKKVFGGKIIECIFSYEDACADLGLDPMEELPYNNPKNAREEAANAFVMLDIITEALLEGKKLDWQNSGQKKWYPVFNYYTPSGFRFQISDYAWSYTGTTGGARLCVDSLEKSNHLGSQYFINIWNKFLNPRKKHETN